MPLWEYCLLNVTEYREGTGGAPRELLALTLPGSRKTSVTSPFGSVGLLNELGGKGWELAAVLPGAFYLKRVKA